jgi:O-antigen/teichoic acid export membrane protein
MAEGRLVSSQEDVEQRFSDMLQQLRVVQTGVQILSAFLLTLPFTNRFPELDTADKSLYTISLVAAAVSTALIIAPVSYRQRVGRRSLENVVKVASRLAEAGLVALMIAVVCAVTLAVRVALGSFWAAAIGAAIAAVYLTTWYVLPAWHRLRRSRRPAASS